MAAALSRFKRAWRDNWLIELLTLALLTVPVFHYFSLKNSLTPSAPGQGGAATLLLIPLVGAGIWLLFSAIALLPARLLNTPVRVGPANQEEVTRISNRGAAGIKFVLMLMLAMLARDVTRIALGQANDISPLLPIIGGLGPFPIVIWMWVRLSALRKSPQRGAGNSTPKARK